LSKSDAKSKNSHERGRVTTAADRVTSRRKVGTLQATTFSKGTRLKRPIGALYFQCSGLSKDPQQLATLTHASAEAAPPAPSIRDP